MTLHLLALVFASIHRNCCTFLPFRSISCVVSNCAYSITGCIIALVTTRVVHSFVARTATELDFNHPKSWKHIPSRVARPCVSKKSVTTMAERPLSRILVVIAKDRHNEVSGGSGIAVLEVLGPMPQYLRQAEVRHPEHQSRATGHSDRTPIHPYLLPQPLTPTLKFRFTIAA